MGMRVKQILLFLLIAGLLLVLSGCRTRISGVRPGETTASIEEGGSGESGQGETHVGISGNPSALETEGHDPEESDEAANQTRNHPESSKKEYDENGQAEINPGSKELIHNAGEGSGAPLVNEEEKAEDHFNDQAELPAVQMTAVPDADKMTISREAEEADSALTYYSVLLEERMGSLFECQRANIYLETEKDYVTVHKSSIEHSLILQAGAYDVSSRLLAENLQVNAGWVFRKNPQVIVKFVDSNILGSAVNSAAAAKAVYHELQTRDQWETIDAIQSKKVLIVSNEYMQSPYLQIAACLMIAKTANPDLLADVDPEEALDMLMEEATGKLHSGIWYYSENGL